MQNTSSSETVNALKGKRILVTGGAGFVGSHIVDQLMQQDVAKVVVIDNMVRGRLANLAAVAHPDRLEVINADIRDRELLDGLIGNSDVVFHQAALRITHCAAEPRHAFEVMGQSTFDLIESCVKHRVEKLIAASSASIYGLAPEFPTTEAAAPYSDRTLYGGLKLLNESLLRSFNDMFGLNYCALRYFNVYGTRMDIHGRYTEVLIRWMERIAAGQAPIIFGDGLQTMDFIDVRDVARANIAAALSPASDQVYNVASGEEVSLKQLADALLKTMGRPDLSIEYMPARSVNPVERRLADPSKAKEQLSFEATISLEQGLSDLVEWWQQERALSMEAAQ
ncbi:MULTISPECIES: NAD-dependent epimerase/dehydratase family protein [unclassified Ensifer]|uniref:NAD-dependent epimerase/dehydratase family protein n=1 Tax=Ensifer TaxID=106591 RepID=UPI00070AC497|nr:MULTISPECIES: NAD-dependent epimerase/dehydratase family protein [unclassified Ensifer]KQW61571.1 NAD-dependent epimerase [Ensifer sp. Root1252]KRC54335.1 NAD-dependent epimerase [Ensifer sp. Root231]KRD01670.1 NAD-dependent epimerase [Ensifer sp. Root258]